jgi:hypothetical protein
MKQSVAELAQPLWHMQALCQIKGFHHEIKIIQPRASTLTLAASWEALSWAERTVSDTLSFTQHHGYRAAAGRA